MAETEAGALLAQEGVQVEGGGCRPRKRQLTGGIACWDGDSFPETAGEVAGRTRLLEWGLEVGGTRPQPPDLGRSLQGREPDLRPTQGLPGCKSLPASPRLQRIILSITWNPLSKGGLAHEGRPEAPRPIRASRFGSTWPSHTQASP